MQYVVQGFVSESVSFAEMWMDLETVIQREVKSEREKQISYVNTYMWNLEKWYRWIYLQSRNRDTDVRTDVWTPRGERGEWDELGDWD